MKKRLLNNLVVSEVGMGCMGLSHGYGAIPSEEESIAAIRAAYEAGCTFFDTAEAYSPNLQGKGHNELILGKVGAGTDFSHSDDVRKFVPQLSRENIAGNQAILDLVGEYAAKKNATMAQVSLAWMLHKWPNVVPVPGSKNKGRILENLGAADVVLSKSEFEQLDRALDALPVKGFRGHVEFQGGSMADWGKR